MIGNRHVGKFQIFNTRRFWLIIAAIVTIINIIYNILHVEVDTVYLDVPLEVNSTSVYLIGDEESSLAKPILISVVTPHYLGSYRWEFDDQNICMLKNVPLKCSIEDSDRRKEVADALWYHLPTVYEIYPRYYPLQLRIGFSMESSAYYQRQSNPDYMKQFDIKMTYELDSDVVAFYQPYNSEAHRASNLDAGNRINGVAYINRNCRTPNNREQVVRDLMKHFRVDAHGRCLHNVEGTSNVNKMEIFNKYKFCIAMENSNRKDYVSEKIWQAFEAGCIPIYMGAPNIVDDFLPDNYSAIIYDPNIMTVKYLGNLLMTISMNDRLYNKYISWHFKNMSQLKPGYQKLNKMMEISSSCKLCQEVAKRRYENQKLDSIETIRQ